MVLCPGSCRWSERRFSWVTERRVAASLAVLFLLYTSFSLTLYTTTCRHQPRQISHRTRTLVTRNRSAPKRVLAWTPLPESEKTWDDIFYRLMSHQCEVNMCEVVYDQRLYNTADALVFHPMDTTFPLTRTPDQVWIFFSQDPPKFMLEAFRDNLKKERGFFNWTMTYRRDSDVVVPYGRVIPRTQPYPLLPARDYWASKSSDKLVAHMAICNPLSEGALFVQKFTKYVKVDTYGTCGVFKCNLSLQVRRTVFMEECNEEIERYMFHLSTESWICDDYVTEKLYKILRLNVIPVVLGGADYTTFAPPHSYINAADFPSLESLATYLNMVASNSTLYNKYFEWKAHYQVEMAHPLSPMVCDLCAKLHNHTHVSQASTETRVREAAMNQVLGRDHTGTYPDIYGWFVNGSACRTWQAATHAND
ncbi:alpha-(1,3)-fucosyltransferase C-like [Panulirus ornatus]|uniref:alpha-(1,3)-fucosyltransferase C-like n=1 Tax=Panulirus ornatus TaxID=150431 RepID=UPI003A84625A